MINEEYKVKLALLTYQQSGGADTNAGWNIIRYVKKKLIKWNNDEVGTMFYDAYPQCIEYPILQLAKAGKLYYNPSVTQQLENLKVLQKNG